MTNNTDNEKGADFAMNLTIILCGLGICLLCGVIADIFCCYSYGFPFLTVSIWLILAVTFLFLCDFWTFLLFIGAFLIGTGAVELGKQIKAAVNDADPKQLLEAGE